MADIPVDIATPDDGWLCGDLDFHTNYSDDALDQAGDWTKPALAIADAWRAPARLEANPTRSPTDHLPFIVVTDHRTVAGLSDPDFVHDDLVLLRGEEFGSDGHAGGLTGHVPHEVQRGETATARAGVCGARRADRPDARPSGVCRSGPHQGRRDTGGHDGVDGGLVRGAGGGRSGVRRGPADQPASRRRGA